MLDSYIALSCQVSTETMLAILNELHAARDTVERASKQVNNLRQSMDCITRISYRIVHVLDNGEIVTRPATVMLPPTFGGTEPPPPVIISVPAPHATLNGRCHHSANIYVYLISNCSVDDQKQPTATQPDAIAASEADELDGFVTINKNDL